MKITERDIFNYVFFPDIIQDDNKKAIERNNNFNEIIDFYKELKDNSNKNPGKTLQEKIAGIIPSFFLPTEILLYPVKSPSGTETKNHRLAADSESRNLKSKLVSWTFADEQKEYMVKVLKNESETKFFVFSSSSEILHNFDLIIEPSKIKFHFEDNTQPLVLDQKHEIDSIRLEFNHN